MSDENNEWRYSVEDIENGDVDTDPVDITADDNSPTLYERLTYGLYFMLDNAISAAVLALITGAPVGQAASMFLTLSMNILALPLALAGTFQFEAWVWYVVAVSWLSQVAFMSRWGMLE